MFWNRYFWPSFFVLVGVALLHWIACVYDFYETTWWADTIMHFLGGLWTYLFILWVSHTQYGVKLLPYTSARNLLIIILFVGVAWELLELALGFTNVSDPRYPFDTPKDLVMDMLGAVVGLFFFKK
jgi:hypothetical protein